MMDAMLRRKMMWASAGALLCTASGCIQRDVREGMTLYAYEGSAALSIFVGGLLTVLLGWRAHDWSREHHSAILRWLGSGLVGLGTLASASWGAELLGGRVGVDKERAEIRVGAFCLSSFEVRFGRLQAVRLTTYPFGGVGRAHGWRGLENLEFVSVSGAVKTVFVSGLMEAAAPEILRNAQARGVPVIDLRAGPH